MRSVAPRANHLAEVYVLPEGDFTPAAYSLPSAERYGWLKRPVRRFVYPILNAAVHPWLATRHASPEFRPDLWLWGQRGNDYERHRRRVSRLFPLKGARLLVAGCGTGRDLESWVAMGPSQVSAVDWFRHDRAWSLWQDRFLLSAPRTAIQFMQGDLAHMTSIADASCDVVGSDAVFEHLRDLPSVLKEFRRVLRPGGLVYATFGPLWYGWGGDHVSGHDRVESGFNHLVLSRDDWLQYVDAAQTGDHSEHDGRTWIRHDLFSRLRPTEYLECLAHAGFQREFVSAIIDPRALRALQFSPDLRSTLLRSHRLHDLLVCGMTVIARRI